MSVTETRQLPRISYKAFVSLKAKELKGLAGFTYYVRSSKLERSQKTVPEWQEAYRAFMARPTK